jgi:hypothetical protein
MALNWTMLNDDRSPIPLPNEQIIDNISAGAEIALFIPNSLPTDGGPGPSATASPRKIRETGQVWLTDQRVRACHTQSTRYASLMRCARQLIFATLPQRGFPQDFDTLSVPLHAILATRFEQPLFGMNYLAFDIKPSPEGGLTDGTKAELRLTDRAMFQFVSMVEKTRERAIYMKRQSVLEDEEGLRESLGSLI